MEELDIEIDKLLAINRTNSEILNRLLSYRTNPQKNVYNFPLYSTIKFFKGILSFHEDFVSCTPKTLTTLTENITESFNVFNDKLPEYIDYDFSAIIEKYRMLNCRALNILGHWKHILGDITGELGKAESILIDTESKAVLIKDVLNIDDLSMSYYYLPTVDMEMDVTISLETADEDIIVDFCNFLNKYYRIQEIKKVRWVFDSNNKGTDVIISEEGHKLGKHEDNQQGIRGTIPINGIISKWSISINRYSNYEDLLGICTEEWDYTKSKSKSDPALIGIYLSTGEVYKWGVKVATLRPVKVGDIVNFLYQDKCLLIKLEDTQYEVTNIEENSLIYAAASIVGPEDEFFLSI